jgi:putative transcriptional regulator
MINLDPKPNQKPARGKVLLSEPFLSDPFFKKTVVLLCDHDTDGAFCFVLNNYVEVRINQVIDDFPDIDSAISIGGPVKNTNLFFIHTLGEEVPNAQEVIPGVYFGGDFDVLKEKLKSGEADAECVRFFIGYSGWSGKQLQEELDSKSWFVTSISAEWVMNTQVKDLWKEIMQKLGAKGKLIAKLPDDPELN